MIFLIMLERTFPRRKILFGGLGLFFYCGKTIIEPEKILSDEETRNLVETLLINNSTKYLNFKKNALLSLGEKGKIQVDYLITKKDETNSVVNYIGEGDNSDREFSNQKILKEYSIPNIYFGPGTKSEITLKINNFINKDFKD